MTGAKRGKPAKKKPAAPPAKGDKDRRSAAPAPPPKPGAWRVAPPPAKPGRAKGPRPDASAPGDAAKGTWRDAPRSKAKPEAETPRAKAKPEAETPRAKAKPEAEPPRGKAKPDADARRAKVDADASRAKAKDGPRPSPAKLGGGANSPGRGHAKSGDGRDAGRREPPVRSGRPPIGKGPPPRRVAVPAGRPLRLPATMYQAWRSTIIELARFPRGASAKDYTPDQLLLALTRQEAGAVADLWEVFTQDREALSRGLLGAKRQAVAYLLGFHLPNAARAQLLLERAGVRHPLATALAAGPLTWHDLGAGTGAVAHAAAAFALRAGLPAEQLSLHLYDGVGPLLDAARTLFGHAGLAARLATHRVGLESLDIGRMLPATAPGAVTGYSLGYVWNELGRNPVARARLEQLFAAALTGQTLLAVLEPATQALCREAMTLRDRLVELGYVPLYPCPAAAACPMLQVTRDWCYSEGTWDRPESVVALDGFLRIDRGRLSGTLLLFAAPPLARCLASAASPRPVVVGRPQRLAPARPDEFDYLLCTGTTLEKAPPPPGNNFLLRGMPLSD